MPIPFVSFELERWQSTWENRVRFNLSESGVHPLSARELFELAAEDPDALLDTQLVYSQSNGTDLLRSRISALYPEASPDQILVTNGSSEANFVLCWRLIEPGDRVVVMVPNYLQTWGLVQNLGARVAPLEYPADARTAITPGTKLVVITNPQNPTGEVLSPAARREIIEACRATGAWLLADEVYQGAELDGQLTESLWGTYERTIVVNGLSKAYGLPGLRIGWIVAPRPIIAEAWGRRDYTTIGPSPLSDRLASLALEPTTRAQILERTRLILATNYPVLHAWLKRFGSSFSWAPPHAGAICWVRFSSSASAIEIVEHLRTEHSVLLVPGEYFGSPGHLRFGYGDEREHLKEGLAEAELGLEPFFED